MKFCQLILFISALCVGAASANAGTIVIPFSGGPGLGSGSIAPGESYEYNGSVSSSWGAPGVGAGSEAFKSTMSGIEDFTITFSGLGSGIVIDNLETPGNCSGFDLTTRFCVGGTMWTPVISNGGLTITFTAPGGNTIANGTQFFVNIAFSGHEQDTASFTGGWSVAAPEPSAVFTIAIGLVALGLLGWRRGRV
jgi:hypothetical protein